MRIYKNMKKYKIFLKLKKYINTVYLYMLYVNI